MLETLQKSNFRVSDELHQPTAWRSSLLEIPGELSDPIQLRNIAQSSSFNTTAVLNGTLDTTDPSNPTRTGSFRDDYLLTNLVAGQSVQLNLSSSVFDTYLQVVNAATGVVVAENDNFSGTNSQLDFTTQAGVDYIVRATSTALGATGAYSLISNNGILTSATPISGSQTVSGTLVTSDPADPLNPGTYYDGYLLTNLIAGQVVQVNLNSTTFDSYLQVVNANTGQIVAFNDDANGTLNSQLVFSVESGVDYIIQATSYRVGVTGNYTLTTQFLTLPEGYNSNYGYGLVNAATAVASALGQSIPFADVPNLGGNAWGLDMINAPEVWAQGYTGQGVVVAVVDSGVDYTHPDLDGNIWVNSDEIAGDGVDNDNNGFIDDVRGWDFAYNDNDPMDVYGHGTHVSGTIAAKGNNSVGVTGVAWNAKIMPLKFLGDGGYGNTSDAILALNYATAKGVKLTNNSWS